jgi:glycosyltransferase involved in cell wall biosynthesis
VDDAEFGDRLTVIANGVDVAAARRRADGPPPHRWLGPGNATLLAVGRLDAQKNHETLIDALAHPPCAGQCRLLIVGASSRADRREALLARAAARGVADRVEIVGNVDNVFPYYRHAACFVLPSWWEGASNALLEALAVGARVAASKSAGNAAHLLAGGRHGRLFDPADAAGIADAIARQLADATAIESTGAIAHTDVSASLEAWSALLDRLGASSH